ncbi:MAG: flagellar filament capping protein FliD [Caldimicrobium sp.]
MADFYTSNVTGLLDVDAIVKSLTLVKQKQIQKIAQEKALLQAKASSVANLLSGVKELEDFINNLKVDDLFKGKSASVSDPSIITAEVTDKAPNINLSLKVLNLSQGEIRITSSGVNDLNTPLSPANFTLKYWTDNQNSVETTINFSGGTIEDLVKTINQAQDKISASVYFDGNAYRLMLAEKDVGASSKETDVANNSYVIEISSGSLPSELGSLDTTLQNAQNAKIKIGSDTGPEVTSPTNTFKDLVSGLKITALKPSESFVQVNITQSYTQVKQALGVFFNKINGVIDLVKELTKKGGLFQGNQSITQISERLFSLTKPLQDLGLVSINDRKYSLNSSSLDALIQNGDLDKIKDSLRKTHKNFQTYLEGLTKTLQNYQKTQDNKINALDLKAQELQKSLIKEEEKLRLTFSKIEALMAKNENLKTRLENFVVSLSEANKK